jgi:hypothetical protein
VAKTTEEVIELPDIDGKYEQHDHVDLTDDEAELGHVVYREVIDLDDESNGLVDGKAENQ